MNLLDNLSIAINAAFKAGVAIMRIYENEDFGVDFKSDNSPLTKADIASHDIIEAALQETKIPILSEEGKAIPYETRAQWNLLWIVDPIDGTKEFIKRNGEFTVNIALIENNTPILGVIYVPALKDLYFSATGIGSYKVQNFSCYTDLQTLIDRAQKLPIKDGDRPFTVVASRSHLSKETEDFIDSMKQEHGTIETISKGSSLKLCMVAEGKADCYPRFAPTMEWDTAAGQAICKYAGIDVIDMSTKETMLYNRKELLNNWFLVK